MVLVDSLDHRAPADEEISILLAAVYEKQIEEERSRADKAEIAARTSDLEKAAMRERLAVAADAISGAESRAEIAEELARKSDLETAAMRERLAAAEDAIREAESRAGIAEDRAHKSDLETAAMRERLAAAEYAIREAESRAGIAEQLASEVPSIIERLAKAEEEASEALEKLADAERALDEETEKRRRAEEAIVAAAQDVVAMSEDAGRDREEDSYVYHSEDDANSRSVRLAMAMGAFRIFPEA